MTVAFITTKGNRKNVVHDKCFTWFRHDHSDKFLFCLEGNAGNEKALAELSRQEAEILLQSMQKVLNNPKN